MDLITHGLLGATSAATLAPSHQRRLAAAVGMVGEISSADEAPAFVTRREVTSEIRQAFIAMLLGR